MKMIVAVDENWAIGNGNQLLCHIPEDLKYFKKKTTGKVVIMGRKTLESLPGGKPLPNRTNVIVTKDENFEKDGCIVVHSLEEVLALKERFNDDDLMVTGGASIYTQLLPYCDTCYVTKIHHRFDADTFIPNLDKDESLIIRMHTGMKEDNGYKFQFLEYRRK
ncbi:MAG: dihydrofolate reductase [Clostridia bacterium]|nr:dihydrofolate reductase [Clostridia bacterium]